MSSSEVMELVARLRPEGADETQDALEDTQETFEETADTAEQSSEELEQFSERFQGALQVAATGLAVAAGGLLSTVPIISELFGGLGAVIQALGIRIDQFLRPALSGVSTAIFMAANAIVQLDGAAGAVFNTLLTVGTVLAGLVGTLVAVVGLTSGWSAAFGTLVAIAGVVTNVLGVVAGAIAGVIGGVSLLAAGIAALLVGTLAFAAAYITNWRNVRTVTNNIVSAIVDFFKRALDTLITITQAAFTILVTEITTRLGEVVNGAARAGNGIIAAFEAWINTVREGVASGMNDVVQTIEDAVNSAIDALNQLPNVSIDAVSLGQVSAGEGVQLGRINAPSDQALQQRRSQTRAKQLQVIRKSLINLSTETAEQFAEALPDSIETSVNVDGREVAKSTDKFRGAPAANRGR